MSGFLDSLLGTEEVAGDDGGDRLLMVLRMNGTLLCDGLPGNPREVKRFLNAAMMRLALLCELEGPEVTSDLQKALLVYLLVTGELPTSLAREEGFIVGLQDHAATIAPGPEMDSKDAERRDHERPALSVDREALAKLSRDTEAAIRLGEVADEALERVLVTLGRVAGSGAALGPDLVNRFSTFGGGVYEREGGVVDLDDKVIAREQEKQEKRRSEVKDRAAPFIEAVLAAMSKGGDPESRVDELLEALRTSGGAWQPEMAAEVAGALRNRRSDERVGLLCEAAHRVLRRAFGESHIANNAAHMAWALSLRDNTIETAAGGELPGYNDPVWGQFAEASVQADPFMRRFWGEELEEIARHGRGMHQGVEFVRGRLEEQEGRRQDGRSWTVEQYGPVEFDGGRSPALARFTLGEDDHWWLVPAGPFITGGLRYTDERAVRVDSSLGRAFLIAEDPVTVEQFGCFMMQDGYSWVEPWWPVDRNEAEFVLEGRFMPRAWEKQSSEADRPVVGITWLEAVAYSLWLNRETGSKTWKAQPWKGPYRLPTEAQWERAARGVFGRLWPWGGNWQRELVVCQDGVRSDSCIDTAANPNRSPFGVRGMAGNVWEWTGSVWNERGIGRVLLGGTSIPEFDRRTQVVGRGGSISRGRDGVRCIARTKTSTFDSFRDHGFRCVRDLG